VDQDDELAQGFHAQHRTLCTTEGCGAAELVS